MQWIKLYFSTVWGKVSGIVIAVIGLIYAQVTSKILDHIWEYSSGYFLYAWRFVSDPSNAIWWFGACVCLFFCSVIMGGREFSSIADKKQRELLQEVQKNNEIILDAIIASRLRTFYNSLVRHIGQLEEVLETSTNAAKQLNATSSDYVSALESLLLKMSNPIYLNGDMIVSYDPLRRPISSLHPSIDNFGKDLPFANEGDRKRFAEEWWGILDERDRSLALSQKVLGEINQRERHLTGGELSRLVDLTGDLSLHRPDKDAVRSALINGESVFIVNRYTGDMFRKKI